MMIFKLSFRNILRNKRRTIITCLIMGLGLAALIFADAFLKGLNQNMISAVTSSFIGDGQIHRNNFLKTREVELTINNSNQTLEELKSDNKILSAVPRTIASAMIASPTDVLSVAMIGINPEEETKIISLKESIISGNYLDNTNSDQVIIGEKLAKFLSVSIGDKVVITTAQSKTGVLSQELFRIAGIFKMKNKEMDSSMVFMNMKKSQELLNIGDNFHEITFKFKNKEDVLNPPSEFFSFFNSNDNETKSWKKLVPAIDAGITLTNYSLYIGSFILFLIIALSTMNTLFMSIYERMFEFGIMKAIGTRPFFIFKMILLEACSLALLSIALGILVGGSITLLTKYFGIHHFTDVEYLGATIKEAIRPVFQLRQYLIYPISILIFAVIASIYPAIEASKIIPSKAMRRD